MSPIGGIGINLAIQDAVAAANILAAPLARGDDVDLILHRVQDRRLLPTGVIQAAQKAAQDRIIGRMLRADSRSPRRRWRSGCSTDFRYCGGFPAVSSAWASGASGFARRLRLLPP